MKVVPVVVEALGTIPKALEKHLKEIRTTEGGQQGFCERHLRSKT